MKKIAFAMLCLSLTAFISCGNAEEEARKEKLKQDSLSAIDGDIAIDRANDLLFDSASTSTDSTVKTSETAEK